MQPRHGPPSYGDVSLNCTGGSMTSKKPTRLKVSRAKPGDLKVRRAKGKLTIVRRQVLKNEPWYASAAMQIGIKAAEQGR
jgi:hypothetical protein